MCGRELHDLEQAELGVDVHHRPMRGEGELHVRLGLAGLGIEMVRAAGMKDAGLLDDRVTQQGREGHDLFPIGSNHGVVLDPQLARWMELGLRELEHPLADRFRRGFDRAAGDVRLA